MAAESAPSLTTDSSEDRLPITRVFRVGAEAVFAFCVFGGVWGFAGVEPEFQFLIGLGLCLVAFLWIARCLLYRRLTLRPDAVSIGLSGIVLFTAVQLVPLPKELVSIISPGSARAYTELRPVNNERLLDEPETPSRTSWIPLTVDRELTRRFLTDVTSVLLAYTIARNWLATRATFRRMAWAATVTGFALATFGIIQQVSSKSNIIFWSYSTQGSVFSTFVYRNHYPFFMVFCIGMCFGNLMQTDVSNKGTYRTSKGVFSEFASWFSDASKSPRSIALLAMLAVMLISVLFSLSRGGLLAMCCGIAATLFLAQRYGTTKSKTSLAPLIAVAGAILVLGFVMNWGPVEKRLLTLFNSQALETRLPLWKDGFKLFPSYPLLGVGNGAFERAELSIRSEGSPELRFEAHSEYLEALVEGGVVRFAFTMLLVYGVLTTTIRAYQRLRGRSVGWLVLGAFFAMVAVTVHSIADFGLHVPTVALLAAGVMGCISAAANDGEFAPVKKTKTTQSGATVAEKDLPSLGEVHNTGRNRGAVVLIGPPALAGLIVVGMLAVVLGLEYYRYMQSEQYRVAGLAMKISKDPDRFQRRINFCSARTSVTPHNGEAYLDLAQAYFDAALNQAPDADFEKNAEAKVLALNGLRAARAARNVCPLLPQSHLRMGIHHKLFAESEPAKVHFERAKKLLPIDAEVWFAAGAEAESRADMTAAVLDWKKSLSLSFRQLEPILKRCVARGMTTDDIRTKVIPDNPEVLVYTPEVLGRILNWDAETQKAMARSFLDKATEVVKAKSNPTPQDLFIVARIKEQIGDPTEALMAYRKAVLQDEENVAVREAFVNFLEREEYYTEVIPHLEWLRDKGKGGTYIRDRIDAARHGVALQKELDR